jgi:hypothetical protein
MKTQTQLPANSLLVASIKAKATISCRFEAFLESTPQFILQLSKVLSTGNISEMTFLILFSKKNIHKLLQNQ